MINIIVACTKRGGIGYKNTIPWDLPADIARFKKLTIGNKKNSVIMGRKTWESLPNKFKPLSNRKNIIISNTLNEKMLADDVRVVKNIDECVNYCKANCFETNWIIGGSMIYNLFLKTNIVDNIYYTSLDIDSECDTFFPNISDYKLSWSEELINNNIKYENKIYRKSINLENIDLYNYKY